MIEVVNTPVTNEATEATTQETPMTEATITLNPPEWTQVLSQFDSLFSAVLKYAEPHIERIVEKKVAEAVVKRIEAIRDIATEIAEAAVQFAMEDHTANYDHDEYDRLASDIDDKVNDAIYDYDFDDKINDALRSYDLEDKIKDTIRDMTFNVSVD